MNILWYHIPRKNVEQIPSLPSSQRDSGTCVCKGRDTMICPAKVTDHAEGPGGVPLDDFSSPLHTTLPYFCTEGIGLHLPHNLSLLSLNHSTSNAKLSPFLSVSSLSCPPNLITMAVIALFYHHSAKAGLHGSTF